MNGVREASQRPGVDNINEQELDTLVNPNPPEVDSSDTPTKGMVDEDEQLLEEVEQDEEQEAKDRQEVEKRDYKLTKGFIFAFILVTLFIALMSAVMTDSGLLFTIMGFTPTILVLIVFIGLLEGNYKDILFWLSPLVICFLFLAIGPMVNVFLGGQLDIGVLTGVNMLLSYLFLAAIMLIEYHRGDDEVQIKEIEDEFKPENIDRYIHTIEDKCKALNFVIGRVYRASHGGTKQLRTKIKVPSEWYNEFNSIRPEEIKEQQAFALDLLRRIQDQLGLLLKPEKDVFTEDEIHHLKVIARDRHGKDRIIDVLTVNDQDPVEDYYLGAVDFCKRVIKHLDEL